METMDKIFEKKERDYSYMRVFFKKNQFYKFYLVAAWKKIIIKVNSDFGGAY